MAYAALFLWLMHVSFMGSIIVGLVLLVKLLLKDKLGPDWNYLIWFLPVLKLVTPWKVESTFSIDNLLRIAVNSFAPGQGRMRTGEVAGHLVREGSPIVLAGLPEDYAIALSGNLLDSRLSVIFYIWLAGVILFALHTTVVNLLALRRLRSGEAITDREICRVFESCKNEMNINGKLELLTLDTVGSPALYGVFRPVLLLPKQITGKISLEQLRYVILHELVHYKRKDILLNWATAFLQILHWFNPVIRYAFYRMRHDRELACDACVLSVISPEERRCYGQTIIALLEGFVSPRPLAAATEMLMPREYFKCRMRMIAGYKKETGRRRICLPMLFLVAALTALPNGKGMAAAVPAVEASGITDSTVYEDLSRYFQDFDGSFVLYDPGKDAYTIYNEAGSRRRVSPCSTIKIVEALAGLETGVLAEGNTLQKWNGSKYPYEDWNRDHTLDSAMRYSVNWYFESVCSRIGKQVWHQYIDMLAYGNRDVSGRATYIGLPSTLKISPIEQATLLSKIFTGQVPFSQKSVEGVKNAIKIAEAEGVVLYGKTGSGAEDGKAVNGWFVGYVEKQGCPYFFATNIQADAAADGKKAREITLSILQDKNIF